MKLWRKYSIGLRTIAGSIILLTGVTVLSIGAQHVCKATLSLNWPSVDGRIDSSGIAKVDKHEEIWVANIGYSYLVGDVPYFNTRKAFEPVGTTTKIRAERIVAEYPAGKPVKVYYNPADPTDSVLEPGDSPQTWDRVALGILATFFGWIIFAPPRRKDVPHKATEFGPNQRLLMKMQFRPSILLVVLWILGSIVMSKLFRLRDPGVEFMLMTVVVLIGACADAAWQKSWRIFRHNLAAVVTVFSWQVVLRQSGVTGISMDLITFIVASTVVAFKRSEIPPRKGAAATEVVGEAGVAVPVPAQPAVADPDASGSLTRMSLRKVAIMSAVFMLLGFGLFIRFMVLRQQAQDEMQEFVQSVYAWFAALGVLIMVLSLLFRATNWRCRFCGATLPDSRRRKTKSIRCPKCDKLNY